MAQELNRKKRNWIALDKWKMKELKEKSVFVNGFAEAAFKRAKQGKDSYMIFSQKRRENFFLFLIFNG